MTKLIVDIPEPKEDYDTSTQRQINRLTNFQVFHMRQWCNHIFFFGAVVKT